MVNAQRLRDALEERGYQILGRGAFDAPRGAAARGWTETGTIDKTGHPVPPSFRESVRIGEQNLYSQAKRLVGDRDARGHEYQLQLRPYDADRSGTGLGLPVLVALVGGLLERSVRGGTIVVGALNLGGSVERLPKPVEVAELAVERQAAVLLMPVSARRDLFDLPDDLWTRINIEFYADPVDAAFKALVD